MKKKGFLIDFENVKSAGLVGLEQLTANEDVVILYSADANALSFEMHQQILQSPACVDYYKIRRGGKNSLDFQLSSLLGYLLGTGDYSHLYVVSNDAGFDVLRDFWSSDFVPNDCVVHRRGNILGCLAHSRAEQNPVKAEQAPAQQAEAQPTEVQPAADLRPAAAEETCGPEAAPAPAAQPEAEPQPAPAAVEKRDETCDEAPAVQPEAEKMTEAPAAKPQADLYPGLPARGAAAAAVAAAAVAAAQQESRRGEEKQPEAGRGEPRADKKPTRRGRRGAGQETKKAAQPTRAEGEAPEETVRRALPAAFCAQADEATLQKVAEMLARADGKQDFYRGIIAQYGQKRGLEIYKNVKSEYANLKKMLE